jgi:hypothetical protein
MARAIQVQGVDHCGVESAADHNEEYATARPARVPTQQGSFDHRATTLLWSRAQIEVSGQEALIAGGKNGQRQTGHGAINQFGRRAVATNGDHGSQASLIEQPIGLVGDFIEIREDRDVEPILAQELHQASNPRISGSCPGLRVDRHNDMSKVWR